MFQTYKKLLLKYWFQVNTQISEQDEQRSSCSSQRYKPFFFYSFEKGNKPTTAYWPHRKVIYEGRLLDPPGRSGNLLFYFIGLPHIPKLNRSKTNAHNPLDEWSCKKYLTSIKIQIFNTNLKVALTSLSLYSWRKHFNLSCASFSLLPEELVKLCRYCMNIRKKFSDTSDILWSALRIRDSWNYLIKIPLFNYPDARRRMNDDGSRAPTWRPAAKTISEALLVPDSFDVNCYTVCVKGTHFHWHSI